MTELVSDAPDLEDLAAYLDDRLSDERRALVEERLARDEDYYDVFMETVRFQEEQSQEEDDSAEIITPAWRQNWKTIAPIAVAATLVTALGLQNLVPSSSVTLIAELNPEAVVLSESQPWNLLDLRRLRSGAYDPELDLDPFVQKQHAFRIGSRIVDLEIALAAKDRHAAGEAAAELRNLTSRVLLLSWLTDDYNKLKEETVSSDVDTLRTESARLQKRLIKVLDSSLTESFELGVWNEVGRLAALSRDRKLLRKIWRRQSLDQEGTPETLEVHHEALQQALESGEDIDFTAAEATFQKIARELAGSA